ncbi:MAG: SDR family oxidoreductase [Rhizomicrobium sp.]
MQGKVAVITGGSSGLGLATAKRFVAEGAFVFITGRRQAELDKAVAEVGADVVAVQADSSVPADLDRVYATIRDTKGKLDIVFANAGVLIPAPLGQITEDAVDAMLSTNLKGIVFTVQKALSLLGEGGSVILTGSTLANKGLAGRGIYAATKAAIRALARSWIVDLAGRGIRINVMSPGAIATPGQLGASPDADAAQRRLAYIASQTPLGRLGTADEVGKVVAFLASDASSLINGADIQADGGWAQI